MDINSPNAQYEYGTATQNCVMPYQYQTAYPTLYQPYITWQQASVSRHYPVKIGRAQNGYILDKDGQEYVFQSMEKLLKFIEAELK